jgi:D-alanine--poly(phosphoribitol) ligase subunit 1
LNGMLSIGKPMKGLEAIIIDNEKKILGANQKGELCISGNQLTPGYWKNPDKNELSFFDLSSGETLKRFYKTGDLCYIDLEGDILYSGRLDYQVKIQGHRVELGEIEHHARSCQNGRNCIATIFENNSGNIEIALFVEDKINDSSDLLETLKLKMPYYMIPTKIIYLEEFPINSNGKIDRNKLKTQIVL